MLDLHQIKDLTHQFKEYVKIGEYDTEDEWMNSKWFGRAIKRLNLYKDKRRVGKGIEVMLNTTKAKEMLENFKGE